MGTKYIISIATADDEVTHRGAEDGVSPDYIINALKDLDPEDLLDVYDGLTPIVDEIDDTRGAEPVIHDAG